MADKVEFDSFSEELRVKSKAIHEKSDKLVNLKLAIALTDMKLYGSVLRDFYCIFKAIEDQVEKYKTKNDYINQIWMSEMSRLSGLQQDLEYYIGLNWKEMEPSQAAIKYSSDIYTVVDKEPELLLAYIHTMYLAILSGGYILKKLITNSLGISGIDGGVSTFDLPDNVTRAHLKDHIKKSIDDMGLDRDLKDRIVQEKIKIFQQNNTLVASIKPTLSSGTRIFKLGLIFICFILFFIFAFKRIFY